MIPSSTILACVLTLCISLVIPLGVLLVLGIRWRKDGFAPAWFIGAAGFFVTQMVIRLPILSLLSANTGFVTFAQEHFILYSLLLAFTAGLFELAGRFAAAKLLKKKPTFRRALAAGLGHGSIEAILLPCSSGSRRPAQPSLPTHRPLPRLKDHLFFQRFENDGQE